MKSWSLWKQHIAVNSLDLSFKTKVLTTQYGKATKHDLRLAGKLLQRLKAQSTQMFFPNLGESDDWEFLGYGDAGVKSMPDRVSGCGGHVVLLFNCILKKACILRWRSKKLKRKVISSLAGEALALYDTTGEIVYIRSILRQIYGRIIDNIPTTLITDSRNLHEAIYSTSQVDDPWLIPDIAALKEALDQGTIPSATSRGWKGRTCSPTALRNREPQQRSWWTS